MNLLLPTALLGLLTMLPILLLHLLRNRRQQVAISSLQLWRGLQQKKRGALPRSIPLSLLLLLQLLVAGALTLGLARPALSFLLSQPQQYILILDRTTSMLAVDNPAAGPRFEAARQAARSYLEGMTDADAFALVTLDSQPRLLLAGEAGDRPQALAALAELAPGATGLNLPAALSLANGLVDPERQSQIIVFTDGNYPVEPETLPTLLAPLTWRLVPASDPEGVSNQALLNVSARTLPDGQHRLFARVVNYSDRPAHRTLRVSAAGQNLDEAEVELDAQGEAARVWTLPARTMAAAVEIAEPDALAADNRAEVLLASSARQRVLLVSASPEGMARALEVQPGVELTVEAPAALPREAESLKKHLAGFDLTVFDGLPVELMDWPAGSLWVINPPLGHTLLPAQNYVRNLRPDVSTGSPLLAGIDLSGVYFNRAPELALPEWAEVDLLAQSATGNPAESSQGERRPLIFHGRVGSSQVVVWAFNLAETNLPARLALPLLTANTLTTLLSPSPPQVVPLGSPVALSGDFSIETPAGRRLFLARPGVGQNEFSQTGEPGLYRIYNHNDTLVAGFAVHAGSALESNLTDRFDPQAFTPVYAPRPDTQGPQVAHQEFWPWLVGLALLVVTLEGWLAWRK